MSYVNASLDSAIYSEHVAVLRCDIRRNQVVRSTQ